MINKQRIPRKLKKKCKKDFYKKYKEYDCIKIIEANYKEYSVKIK